jgi:hypothetical protein
MDNSKRQFTSIVQHLAVELVKLEHQLGDVSKVYNARLYGPGAQNAITEAEMMEYGEIGGGKITPDHIYAFVILCDQLNAFLNNGTPAQGDYAATLNQIRTDV